MPKYTHDCNRFVWPASNKDYWVPKIERNVQRDRENNIALVKMGWRVLTIWEYQLKKKVADTYLSSLYHQIVNSNQS